MKTITSFASRYVGIFLALLIVGLLPALSHAATDFTILQTVANVSPTNDQTDATVTTVPNVVQTKASRVLTAHSVPVASTTSTIGSCVITYSATVADSLNCTGSAAILNTVTHSTAATVSVALRALTNVSDAAHGALTIGSSSPDASFTTTGNETSATNLNFVDGTAGVVTSGTPVTGIVAVAQQNTITVGGTVDTGDHFNITIPTGVVTYITSSGDSSLANIATGINAAIQATTTYASQGFTSVASTNTVVLTAKVAGTPFVQSSAAVNGSAVAEQVTFSPPTSAGSAIFKININGTVYGYADSTGSSTLISAGLATAMAGDPSVTCVGTILVTCTAKVAGTAFTYSAGVSVPTPPAQNNSVGGGSSGGSSYAPEGNVTVINTNPVSVTPVVTTTPIVASGASKIKTTLHYKSRNSSVKILQELLVSDPTLAFKGTFSGYFGLQTKAAVEAFQTKYGVATPGSAGYGTVGPMTRAMLVKVFGN